jgi:hypothetical protein
VEIGVEIRGRPIVRDHSFLGKDDNDLTDSNSTDNLNICSYYSSL